MKLDVIIIISYHEAKWKYGNTFCFIVKNNKWPMHEYLFN